jgi:hypothetical protein
LNSFYKRVNWAPLRPGMSQAEVIDLLGPAQDESVARHPRILKYGGLQLTFLRRPEAADQALAHPRALLRSECGANP